MRERVREILGWGIHHRGHRGTQGKPGAISAKKGGWIWMRDQEKFLLCWGFRLMGSLLICVGPRRLRRRFVKRSVAMLRTSGRKLGWTWGSKEFMGMRGTWCSQAAPTEMRSRPLSLE